MKLNAEGGIDVYIAAEKPDGEPEENWLPINPKATPQEQQALIDEAVSQMLSQFPPRT